jgi:hypothetical protein
MIVAQRHERGGVGVTARGGVRDEELSGPPLFEPLPPQCGISKRKLGGGGRRPVSGWQERIDRTADEQSGFAEAPSAGVSRPFV